MAFGGEDVDAGAEEVEHFADDLFLVFGEVDGELHAGEVGLEEHEGFEMRGAECGFRHFDGGAVVDATEDVVFVAAHLD